MRVAMEELLYSYGVDLVFNGHVSNDQMYHNDNILWAPLVE